MKQWRVEKKVVETLVIEVEAEDEQQAEELAEEFSNSCWFSESLESEITYVEELFD
jgi:organic hydroperoxide reductase OsmC/OhrA